MAMETKKYKVAVIGGGPAGLAAAAAASDAGCDSVAVIERDVRLGGILNQCIHDGFGLHRFGEALSGPEYAARYIDMLKGTKTDVLTGSIVLNLSADRKLLVSGRGRMFEIEAEAVVLATGCRERPRGALSIPGHRPAGVYTAGAAQNFVNMENIMPGRRVVILGSGDIGLIMARRMTLEGAKVLSVFEILPYSSGLPRNIRQCLADYDIPLHLSTTVVEIIGRDRLEAVKVARVDDDRAPIPGTERTIECDTLLLSVGLIPENELAREAGVEISPMTGGAVVNDRYMTSVDGIFSCGNALHVHDLVDFVSAEAARAGHAAAAYAAGKTLRDGDAVAVAPGSGVRYTVPSSISRADLADGREPQISFRVASPSRGGVIELVIDGEVVREEGRRRLHPAEMVSLSMKKEEIDRLAGASKVEVRVR